MNILSIKVIRMVSAAPLLALAGALATGSATAFATAVPSAQHNVPASATYGDIYNTASGKCLGIAGGRDDAPAVLWTCNGHPDQLWTRGYVDPENRNYSQIVNRDGMCLGVAGGSTQNGARIVGWNCQNPEPNNQFWFYDTIDLGYPGNGPVLVNLATPVNAQGFGGKVTGVSGGSTSNGAPIVLWANSTGPNFAPNQAWYTNA